METSDDDEDQKDQITEVENNTDEVPNIFDDSTPFEEEVNFLFYYLSMFSVLQNVVWFYS